MKIIELMQSMAASSDFKKFIVDGDLICRHAWLLMLKLSEKTFYRAWNLLKFGHVHDPCAVGNNGKGQKGHGAVGYMETFILKMGDTCPESGRVYLPCCTSIKGIYEEYLTCLTKEHEQISKTQFYQLWRKHFSHVSFPKVTRMTKCNFCVLVKDIIPKTSDPITRMNLKKERDEHLNRQWQERRHYYKRKAEALSDSKAKMSIILDGMDQAKTYLPHFRGWSTPKDCDRYRLQPHIEGCLVHGRTFYTFVSLEDGQDTNMVLNCLLDALCQESNGSILPPTLYIQLDNCYRENKNRYFIGFMGYLVATHIFDEVQLSFLMVGHTHEDIDQRFSCVSRALKQKSAKTVPELLQVIEESMMNHVVKASRMRRVFDIKSWIEPFLTTISQHSAQHAFSGARMRSGCPGPMKTLSKSLRRVPGKKLICLKDLHT
ncbi:uncharacterized protein [Diadema antillarum]|uniref:uncharacterized protein n=1 Tax=Diadema antillarum TaxID=105358 RepID=UPI003A880605